MKNLIRPAVSLFVLLTAITGLAYPLVVTAVAQTAFPEQSQGSLLRNAAGQPIGSKLIGQAFSEPKYFWGRPSATSPMANNAANSAGSNVGPLNPALVDAVKARVAALQAVDPDNKQPVPVDLVTTSASGVDPHISPAAADYQAARVARERKLPLVTVQALIAANTEGRTLGLLGEPRVNVLLLNLALDQAASSS